MMRTPVLVLAAAVAAAGGALALSGGQRPAAASASAGLAAHTTPVQRRTLSATISQGGILTYRARPDGSPYTVINQARGTYTELPMTGRVISHGQVLYRVDDRPVVLLYGSTPAFRTLAIGARGPDVAELNADLVALGDATGRQLSRRSATFGPATATALMRLQARLGLAQSGMLNPADAVFQPTAVRVTSVSYQPGGAAQPGETVLQGTSTARQVQVALDASQQTSLALGDRVSITLPDNDTTRGVVASVGAVATCPSSAGSSGGSGSGSAATGADSCASGGSQSSSPTITVNVTPLHPRATGAWDRAPVQVGITTATVRGALVVPVTALLAQSGGGYAVEVVGGGGTSHRLVPVSLGLFDDAEGMVQVTGSSLAAGESVVVPGS